MHLDEYGTRLTSITLLVTEAVNEFSTPTMDRFLLLTTITPHLSRLFDRKELCYESQRIYAHYSRPRFTAPEHCRDWGTLHQRIRKAFGFPDYYGENWDAMWDCLTDVFLQPVQRHIVVEGFDAMPQELRAYAAPMQEIFSDLQEKYPWVSVTYR